MAGIFVVIQHFEGRELACILGVFSSYEEALEVVDENHFPMTRDKETTIPSWSSEEYEDSFFFIEEHELDNPLIDPDEE